MGLSISPNQLFDKGECNRLTIARYLPHEVMVSIAVMATGPRERWGFMAEMSDRRI